MLYFSCITLLLHCVAILYNGVLLNHVFSPILFICSPKKEVHSVISYSLMFFPNLYDFLSSVEHFEKCLNCFCPFNGSQWSPTHCLFGHQHSSKSFVFRRRTSYRFEMTLTLKPLNAQILVLRDGSPKNFNSFIIPCHHVVSNLFNVLLSVEHKRRKF